MRSLLEKSRTINKLLQKISGNPVDFFEMAEVLSGVLECSVFIVGRRGQIIGHSLDERFCCSKYESLLNHAERFPESFNQELIRISETETNLKLKADQHCLFNLPNEKPETCNCRSWTIVPVFGGAERIGTLIMSRKEGDFTEEDIVLAEYGAMVVAHEVMRMRTERVEEEARKKAAVQIALTTLSYSEREAIENILRELNSNEGQLVASRIADEIGITRSVIVSALRKFESAGIIESRSLGMKGTYIKVLNEYIFSELNRDK